MPPIHEGRCRSITLPLDLRIGLRNVTWSSYVQALTSTGSEIRQAEGHTLRAT